MSDSSPPPTAGVMEHWERTLRARWMSGSGVFAVVLGLSALLVLTARPVYRAEARLKLAEPPPSSGISPATGILSFFRSGGDPFANDMELLASRTVAEGIAEDAALNVIIDAPRGWYRDSLFTVLTATRSTTRATYALIRSPDGSLAIHMRAPVDSPIGAARPEEVIAFGGVTLSPTARFLGDPAAPEITLRTVPFAEAVRTVRDRLVAERTRRDANVLDLSYDHPDPGLVTRIVASAVSRFLALRSDLQRRESGQIADSLRRVASETLSELRRAESELQRWQERTRLVAPDAQSAAAVERYSDVAAQLALTRSELESLDRLLSRVRDRGTDARPWVDLAAFPRFVQNETIGNLVSRLTTLEGERLVLAERRSPENRDLRLLSEQIAQLESTLLSVVRGYRQAISEQTAGLETRLSELDSLLAGAPSGALELARRQRTVRLLSEVYLLTEQRLRQEELREALTFSNVQVIDPPALRHRPVWPRKRLGLAVGVVVAALSALLAMLVHERADRSVRTAGDIARALDAPVLLVVAESRAGVIEVTREQATLLVRHASNGTPGLVVADPRDAPVTAALARALAACGVAARTHDPVATPQAAATAAAGSESLAMVVHLHRTDRRDLARAGQLLRATGGRIAGAVVVMRNARDGRAFFA